MSWVPASERGSSDSELGETRRLCALRAPRVGWVESWRCKSSQHRKIVSLPPHIKKPFNSKRWIKVSYLNQFRECRVFRIPYVYFTHLYIMGMLQKAYYVRCQNCSILNYSVLELWGVWSNTLLTLFPDPLWPRMVVLNRALCMGNVELNCVFMRNWITWNRTVLTLKLYLR